MMVHVPYRIVVILSLVLPLVVGLPACVNNAECENLFIKGSVCRQGTCTNPFYEQGCLATVFAERGQAFPFRKRVCHSEDPPEALEQGYCVAADEALSYAEIRIATQNWESVYMEAWMLQILLQEVLGVPVTLETGSPDVNLDFYNPEMSFGWGAGNDWPVQSSATVNADCRQVPKMAPDGSYQACAHLVPEVWATQSHNMDRLQREGVIEPPMGLGMIGQQAWYIPKFVVESDPTLLTYFGLAGEANRHKLADIFRRPATWGAYCSQVSATNCTKPDGIAARPPQDESEGGMYFAGSNKYIGHFRKTAENDCETYPDRCTGHIADYPCGWSSFVEQQAFHLDISLRSSGLAPGCRGYTYGELTQIAAASNATRSPVIMQWWTPDALIQTYSKTPFELQAISMPPATQECMDATVTPEDRCHPKKEVRVGSAEGACAEPPYPLQKVVSVSLFDITQHPSIQDAQQSPAYELIKTFSLTALEIGQLFDAWLNHPSSAGNGFTLRHSTCLWIVDNWDKVSDWIPRNYPRVTRGAEDMMEGPLGMTTIVLAILSTVAVLITAMMTYRQRERPVIRYAQIRFLYIVLTGLVLVSIGSLVSLATPSTATCVTSVWLINLGYTLEIVPLIVKVGAVQRLLHAARQARRVVLDMRALYAAVAGITSLMIVFLLLWSILDTPRSEALYTLSSDQTENGETIVWVRDFCTSDKNIWRYVAALWHALLLVAACVLAFSTRKIKTDFNENQALTLMVYSHVIFVLLRALTYTLDFGEGGETDAVLYRSLIFSADSLVTILIYFVSKFITKDEPNAGVVDLRTSQLSNAVITPHGVRNAAMMNWTASSSASTSSDSGHFRHSGHRRQRPESVVFPSIMECDDESSTSVCEVEKTVPSANSTAKSCSPPASADLPDLPSYQIITGLRCRHCGKQVYSNEVEPSGSG